MSQQNQNCENLCNLTNKWVCFESETYLLFRKTVSPPIVWKWDKEYFKIALYDCIWLPFLWNSTNCQNYFSQKAKTWGENPIHQKEMISFIAQRCWKSPINKSLLSLKWKIYWFHPCKKSNTRVSLKKSCCKIVL